jgi:hypothetical protein
VPESCLLDGEDADLPYPATQGAALFDYLKQSPNELTIRQGDVLLITKKYHHWLLAENAGDTGWVPSSYVRFAKATTGGAAEGTAAVASNTSAAGGREAISHGGPSSADMRSPVGSQGVGGV